MKKISVIVPCYNAAAYIDECIESIVNQTIGIEQIQLIIVDDASTDDSVEHVMKYVDKYPDDIYLELSPENAGQANARNIGMDLAEAPYLVFVDGDDWIREDFCEKMLAVVAEQECDLVQCGWVTWKENVYEYDTEVKASKYYEILSVKNPEQRIELMKSNSFSGIIGCSLLRTVWLRENGIRFKNYRKYEDNYFDAIIRYQFGTYCAVPENMYYYRILAESNSHARNDRGHFVRLKIEEEKILYYQRKGLFETYYTSIREDFFRLFYLNTLHIIFTQFDEIPMDVIRYMQGTVKRLFPDYLKGIDGVEVENDVILTLQFNFPIERWEQYKQAYMDHVINKDYTAMHNFHMSMRKAIGDRNIGQ